MAADKVLRDLKRFVVAHDNEGERHEIREYLLTHAAILAPAFGVSEQDMRYVVATVSDDAKLAAQVLFSLKTAMSRGNEAAREALTTNAQASADVIGDVAHWYEWGAADVDILSLLASALISSGLLVFQSDAFAPVAVPMFRLRALAKLERMDLTATVDANGLHIRWSTGGLNLRGTLPPPATIHIEGVDVVTVNLSTAPAMAKEAA